MRYVGALIEAVLSPVAWVVRLLSDLDLSRGSRR